MVKTEALEQLFKSWAKESCQSIQSISAHGSVRRYFRLESAGKKAIGAFNPDATENDAFCYLSAHFHKKGLKVPQVYAREDKNLIYLLQDLGDVTLFGLRQESALFTKEVESLYQKVVKILPDFQITAARDLDFSRCYPRAAFDRQSMQWDLNYFKYYFLKPSGILFHEQKLEDDFQKLIDFLLGAPQDYFLYRDFQSRNIMIQNGEPWFIDFQGGRRGALPYDIASLLFDAKADIPMDARNRLLQSYMEEVSRKIKIDTAEFRSQYYGYVLMRILQALGAYGFRGLFERKVHFLQSIPFAQKNLAYLLDSNIMPLSLPAVEGIIQKICQREFVPKDDEEKTGLTVHISSFSYKQGLPQDNSPHGGGFIFDCRSLPNPGRYPQYQQMTGEDRPVIEFLEKEESVHKFIRQTREIVHGAVDNYLTRKFTHLSVAFGCTGGQHRSVYFANQLASYLRHIDGVAVQLSHREQEPVE